MIASEKGLRFQSLSGPRSRLTAAGTGKAEYSGVTAVRNYFNKSSADENYGHHVFCTFASENSYEARIVYGNKCALIFTRDF